MSVKLISYTQPSAEFVQDNPEINDVQELVAYCARVSNPSNQHNTKTSDRLIQYLIDNKHWSPLEMVSVCLEINTTRDIARQILRHRSFSFQEFSQRYANTDAFGDDTVIREARLQDTKNRQNSIEISPGGSESTAGPQLCLSTAKMINDWGLHQQSVIETAKEAYQWAIENGIAKEQARVVLPEGLTPSRIYMNGTMRSWLHYIEIRTHESTQKEHRLIAEGCAEQISKIFPMIES